MYVKYICVNTLRLTYLSRINGESHGSVKRAVEVRAETFPRVFSIHPAFYATLPRDRRLSHKESIDLLRI